MGLPPSPTDGPMVFYVACLECEPGILPIPFDSEEQRSDWQVEHANETGHHPSKIFQQPADHWD